MLAAAGASGGGSSPQRTGLCCVFLKPQISTCERCTGSFDEVLQSALLCGVATGSRFKNGARVKQLVKGLWMGGHQTYVEESTWYSEGGEENYSGGFWKYSRRYKELTLEGPFKAEDLRIKVTKRKAYCKSGHRWPAGRIANFVPANAVKTAKTPAEKE